MNLRHHHQLLQCLKHQQLQQECLSKIHQHRQRQNLYYFQTLHLHLRQQRLSNLQKGGLMPQTKSIAHFGKSLLEKALCCNASVLLVEMQGAVQ
jgi:hypothetical protein